MPQTIWMYRNVVQAPPDPLQMTVSVPVLRIKTIGLFKKGRRPLMKTFGISNFARLSVRRQKSKYWEHWKRTSNSISVHILRQIKNQLVMMHLRSLYEVRWNAVFVSAPQRGQLHVNFTWLFLLLMASIKRSTIFNKNLSDVFVYD